MKKMILIFSFLSMLQICFAQSSKMDSLLNVLHNLKKDDTAKVALMNKIAFAYYFSDFNKGNKMADSAIALAKKLNDKHYLAAAFNTKALNISAAGNNNGALDTFKMAASLYEELKDDNRLAKSLNYVAGLYHSMSYNDSALQYGLRALKIAKSLNDASLLADIYNNLGNITIDNFPLGIEYYLKALDAFKQAKSNNGVAEINVNIGCLYINAHEPAKGIQYLQTAYNIFKQGDEKQGMWYAIHNTGVAYKLIGHTNKSLPDFKKALGYFQRSLELSKEAGLSTDSDIENLGQLYNELHDHDKAITYLQQALPSFESGNIAGGIARILTYLSNSILYASDSVLKKYGFNSANRYQTSLAYQYRAIKIMEQSNDYAARAEEWNNLDLIYEKQKRFDSALIAFRKYYELNDSAFNIEKSNELTRKAMQYDFDKKEALLKSQQQLASAEISKQKLVKNFILAGAVFLLFTLLIIFIFYKKRRDANQRQKEAEFKALVADTEMKALRLQMNPHFIFNSLNSVGYYISKNDLETADDFLSKFAKLMRLVLENSEEKEISLAKDLQALELYMQLEALRLDNKFTYEIKVDENIDIENTLIPPLMLQPFVENSIWHGIAHKQGTGKIIISIKKEAAMIHCTIEDDGIGIMQATQLLQKKSLGIKITTSRIDILNKIKNTTASVQVSGLKQGLQKQK